MLSDLAAAELRPMLGYRRAHRAMRRMQAKLRRTRRIGAAQRR